MQSSERLGPHWEFAYDDGIDYRLRVDIA